jgi:hypothetical protein
MMMTIHAQEQFKGKKAAMVAAFGCFLFTEHSKINDQVPIVPTVCENKIISFSPWIIAHLLLGILTRCLPSITIRCPHHSR